MKISCWTVDGTSSHPFQPQIPIPSRSTLLDLSRLKDSPPFGFHLYPGRPRCPAVSCGVLRCPAVSCGVLRCPAVSCGALRCPAVPCGALRCPGLPFDQNRVDLDFQCKHFLIEPWLFGIHSPRAQVNDPSFDRMLDLTDLGWKAWSKTEAMIFRTPGVVVSIPW